MIRVTMLKPLCSPDMTVLAGKTVELSDKQAKDLIEAGAAVRYVDPKASAKASADAVVAAKKAIDKSLKADIADVNAQLAKDKVKTGAKVADLQAAANGVIEELIAKAEEAKAAL